MTGEEMERAIEFLLRHQATLEERVEQTQAQLAQTQAQLAQTQAQVAQTQTQLAQAAGSIAELNRVVQMQAASQGELNQMLTRAVTGLAEAQAKTEARVERLATMVESLLEGGDG